ncbi:MAG: hypothetical protein K2K16_09605 [Ruminococcus sp.]|nr:hypothetical protein [Ruminococcus sp.]
MKRFVSILLCFLIPFWFTIPVNSSALDVQGTEYPTPLLLPPDIDFSKYDYYFLTVSGKPDNPSYTLYLFEDVSDVGKLYFSIAKTASDTKYHFGEFTSFGISTNYSVLYSYYNNTTGLWSSFSKASSVSLMSNFVFDGYSDFSSSSSNKYIIGSNCDIYSYSGLLLRTGDYDNFRSFFMGNLSGSSDKTEKPTEPTTSGDGSGSVGGVNIDLSGISDFLDRILNQINKLITAIKSIDISVKFDSSEISDKLSEINTWLSNFTAVYSYNIEHSVSSLLIKLDEIKTEILNFERYFSEFSAVNGEIANIFTVLNGLNINITNIHTKLMEIIEYINNIKSYVSSISSSFTNLLNRIPSDFGDWILNIKNNVSFIRSDFTSLLNRIPSDFGDWILNIKNNVSSIRSDLHNLSSGFSPDIFFTNISLKIDSLIDDIKLSIGRLFDDISVKLDSLDFSGIIRAINAVEMAVNNLPDSIEEILKYLFIPTTNQPEELMKIINEHFGFINQIVEIGDAIFNEDNFDDDMPEYTIVIDSDLFGHFEADIIDFSIIPYDYIYWFKKLVSGITCYFFILRVRKRLPDIINGEGS